MSILKKLFPGSSHKNKVPSDINPPKDENGKEKGWLAAIHRFNDNVAQLVTFNSKLLIFIMLVFFVYLLFASVFQGETFSINQINVHSEIAAKGYNSTFIAKKISYNITTLVNEVPDKLISMFAAEEKEKNEILYKRIMAKYVKKEIKIDMDVNVGGINLPLHDFTKTARSLFNVEDKSLDGDLTVEDDLIIMTLGFNSNGINKSYKSIKYNIVPDDNKKLYDVVEDLTRESAIFVLSQYDPLVTLLIDYNKTPVYNLERNNQWEEKIFKEKERLQVLEKMYLNEKKDKELALWSQAITGCIYTDIFSRRKKIQEYNTIAIQHFEKAVEMDASFIDIVGLDLANAYKNVEDSTSLQNVIKTYKRMIKSSRDNMLIYQKLFDIYSVQNNEEEYFIALEQAFKNGLYIPEDKINRSQYKKFNKLEQFKTLVSKYNERNKPLFLTN